MTFIHKTSAKFDELETFHEDLWCIDGEKKLLQCFMIKTTVETFSVVLRVSQPQWIQQILMQNIFYKTKKPSFPSNLKIQSSKYFHFQEIIIESEGDKSGCGSIFNFYDSQNINQQSPQNSQKTIKFAAERSQNILSCRTNERISCLHVHDRY